MAGGGEDPPRPEERGAGGPGGPGARGAPVIRDRSVWDWRPGTASGRAAGRQAAGRGRLPAVDKGGAQ